MNSVIRKFQEATTKWITAPSGIEYRIRGIATVEYGALLKAMPSFKINKKNGDGPEVVLTEAEQEAEDTSTNEKLAVIAGLGILGMRYQGEETTDIPPGTDIPSQDFAFIVDAINEQSGLKGPTADAVKESL